MIQQTLNILSLSNVAGVTASGVDTPYLIEAKLDREILFTPDLRFIKFAKKLIIDLPSELRLLLENGGRSLPVKPIQKGDKPNGIASLRKVIIAIAFDLDNKTYSNIGSLCLTDSFQELNYEDLKTSLLQPNRYAESLYAEVENLDVAWTEKDLGYIGQIKILDKIFELLDYEDGYDPRLLPVDLSTTKNKNLFDKSLSRVNPFRLNSFHEFVSAQIDTIRDRNSVKPRHKVKVVFQNGLKIELEAQDLVIKVGDRIKLTSLDYSTVLEVIIQKVRGRNKEGYLLEEVQILGQSFYFGELSSDEILINNLQTQREKITPANSNPVIQKIVKRSASSLASILEITDEVDSTPQTPPGIYNSARSNSKLGEDNLEFFHYRPYNNSFNALSFCQRFSREQDCSLVASVEANNRSSGFNRSFYAIKETLRYPEELPLGILPVAKPIPLDQELEAYWSQYFNGKSYGGCLAYTDEFLYLCLKVERKTKEKSS